MCVVERPRCRRRREELADAIDFAGDAGFLAGDIQIAVVIGDAMKIDNRRWQRRANLIQPPVAVELVDVGRAGAVGDADIKGAFERK